MFRDRSEILPLMLSKFKRINQLLLPLKSLENRRFQEEYVGNKAKGRISKRLLQENNARQIFRKTSMYPLTRTRTCGKFDARVRKIWRALFS